tara:strand:+ start:838 stop:1623 length:786 start_codon:yes stop_codon:yes gene_type:complete
MIIDSHCHLNYEPMRSSLKDVITRAKNKNVNYLLTISTVDKDFEDLLNIINDNNEVYGTYGIHPHEAKNHKEINSQLIIERTKKHKKIIGIGETGLDFYYNHSEKSDQIDLFYEHIIAGLKTSLPVIVHTRSAEEDTLNILNKHMKNNNIKVLIHCFTGSKDFAMKLVDLGCYISASGVVTFKKSSDLANTFKNIPNDRLLIETDSPYLSPEPLRGKKNEPSHITHTVRFLSELKGISYDDLSKLTSENFFKLFGNLNTGN